MGVVIWAVCFGGGLLALFLLALVLPKDPQQTGRQPIGKVSDTPPRPTPPAPRTTGIIPGRPGQEVNSGGDTLLPPLRPDPPRPEDRYYARPEANPRLKDRG